MGGTQQRYQAQRKSLQNGTKRYRVVIFSDKASSNHQRLTNVGAELMQQIQAYTRLSQKNHQAGDFAGD
jgi:hypothetical protein